MSDLHRQALKKLPLFTLPESAEDMLSQPATVHPRKFRAYEPVSWSEYFAENLSVKGSTGNVFNVYYQAPGSAQAPLFVMHHGAGTSGLSFAVLTKKLSTVFTDEATPGVLAFDARGHGNSKLLNEDAGHPDYSIETLVTDMKTVVSGVFEQKQLPVDTNVVLVGHSLGGAVVTRYANDSSDMPGNIVGTTMIDIVEGSALEGLKAMNNVLARRPERFVSQAEAIAWHLSTMTLRRAESACVSVPSLIEPVDPTAQPENSEYTWITDLALTSPFWSTWFTGLSKGFLALKHSKLLILAGTDRLDKDLMVGQMQGKFQLVVVAESGHFVQEDEPLRVAHTLKDFWDRNGRPIQIVPKFGKFGSV